MNILDFICRIATSITTSALSQRCIAEVRDESPLSRIVPINPNLKRAYQQDKTLVHQYNYVISMNTSRT